MHYLLTPPHTHIDFGFGVTGDAFKEAADKLDSNLPERCGVLSEHLPINYLRRHAIELFLKSAIVIIHKRLKLSYGSVAYTGEPHAMVKGEWVPLYKIHSVKALWSYLSTLFREQKCFFDSIQRVDWNFPKEVDDWIEEIEVTDPRSTFFRYPNLRNTTTDIPKAVMVESTPEEIVARLGASERGPKQFVLLMEDQEGEVINGYYYAGSSLTHFNEVLKKCVCMFYGMHAALRIEVCGGA